MTENRTPFLGMLGLALIGAAALRADEDKATSPRPPVAAPPPATPAKAGVQSVTALIDIAYLLKHHVGLTCALADLRKAQVDFEKEVVAKREAIASKEASTRLYDPGSREYAELLECVGKARAEMNTLSELKRGEFRRRESQLRIGAYRQIQQEISKCFEPPEKTAFPRHSASRVNPVVLNFDRREPEATDADCVRRIVEQRVVYQKNLDITAAVLERIAPPVESKLDYDGAVERLETLDQELKDLTAEATEKPVDEVDRMMDEWFPPQSLDDLEWTHRWPFLR